MSVKRQDKQWRRKIYFALIIIAVGAVGFITVRKHRLFFVKNQIVYNRYTRMLLPLYHTIEEFAYELPNFLYIPFMRGDPSVPAYQLVIDPDDIEFLNNNLPPAVFVDGVPAGHKELTSEYKVSVPARFFYDGREYDVEVTYRGDHSNHWVFEKKSWEVEFDNDSLFNGVETLKFILPEGREYFSEYLNSYRAKKFGLKMTEPQFVTLSVNSTDYGVYYQFEDWSKEFLEKSELASDANLYVTDDDTINFDDQNQAYTDAVFWKKKSKDAVFPYDNFSEIHFLIQSMNRSDFHEVVPYIIDLDNLYAWHALSVLSGSQHQNDRGNSRMYFNNTSGKFEFIPWDVKISSFGGSRIAHNTLLTKIFSDPIREHERNLVMWDYVSDPKNLADDLATYDAIYKQLRPAFYRDFTKFQNNFRFDQEVKRIRGLYEGNFNALKEDIQNNDVKANVYFNPKHLLVTADVEVDTTSGLVVTAVILPAVTGSAELYYDSNSDGVFLDSEDLFLARTKLNNGNRTRLDGFGQYIHSVRGYDLDTRVSELSVATHSFFITLHKEQSADFYQGTVRFELENAVTQEAFARGFTIRQ